MNTDVLDDIIALGSPRRTITELLDLALGVIVSWLGQAVGGAYLVRGNATELVAQRGLETRGLRPPLAPLPGTGIRMDSHRARVFSASQLQHFVLAQAPGEWEIESLLLLPLDKQARRGFLLLGLPHPLVLTRTKGRLLSTIGYEVGLLIQTADPLTEGNENVSRIPAILDPSPTLIPRSDLGSMLESIVYTAVQKIEKATNGAIYFFNEHENGLTPRPAGAADSTQINPDELRLVTLGQRVAQGALEQVVHISDLASDPRCADLAQRSPHGSLLVAPLLAAERSLGMLLIESQLSNVFTQADEQLAMSLAATAAEAVNNRKPEMPEWSSSGEWNRLLHMDLCRLLRGVAHDLRNPLTAVMGYAQLLQTAEEPSGANLRDLKKIQSQAQKAAKIVDYLSGFARHCAATDKADLNDVLRHLLTLCAHSLEAENIQVDTQLASGELRVEIDSSCLQQVLLRLISYVRDTWSGVTHRGHLQVITEWDGDEARMQCTFGPLASPSIPVRNKDTAYQRVTVPAALRLCTDIVQEHGGTVRYWESEGAVRTWIAELPRAPEFAWRKIPVSLGESDRADET